MNQLANAAHEKKMHSAKKKNYTIRLWLQLPIYKDAVKLFVLNASLIRYLLAEKTKFHRTLIGYRSSIRNTIFSIRKIPL